VAIATSVLRVVFRDGHRAAQDIEEVPVAGYVTPGTIVEVADESRRFLDKRERGFSAFAADTVLTTTRANHNSRRFCRWLGLSRDLGYVTRERLLVIRG